MVRRARRRLFWLGLPLMLLAVVAVRQWRRARADAQLRGPLHRAPRRVAPSTRKAATGSREPGSTEREQPAAARRRHVPGKPQAGETTGEPAPSDASAQPSQSQAADGSGRPQPAEDFAAPPVAEEPERAAGPDGPDGPDRSARPHAPEELEKSARPDETELVEVKVGDVCGLTVDAARGRLVRAGFKARRSRIPAPDGVRPGTVVRQDPEPGTLVPPGSVVLLSVAGASK